MTAEADLAVSVTGHLGPGAPEQFDGLIFVGWCLRGALPVVEQHQLSRLAHAGDDAVALRHERQQEATGIVLQTVQKVLQRSEIVGKDR